MMAYPSAIVDFLLWRGLESFSGTSVLGLGYSYLFGVWCVAFRTVAKRHGQNGGV